MNEKAICKHCDEELRRGSPQEPNLSYQYRHISGLHAGKFTCAIEPYGFHAEPVGVPCGDLPANPCNGAKGYEVRQMISVAARKRRRVIDLIQTAEHLMLKTRDVNNEFPGDLTLNVAVDTTVDIFRRLTRCLDQIQDQ